MTSVVDSLPQDVATLQAMLLTERAARLAAEDEAKFRALQIEKLKYTIAKLRHQKFGQSSERSAILEQLELQLSELQENASEAEAAAQLATPRETVKVEGFERCKPARPSAARAHRLSVSRGLPVLWRGSAQAGRGRHRDAGAYSPPVESDPARAREVLLPKL